ncbi:MAG: PaaI family thioesterase [Fimbriimonadaceae bacterium]|nr:PaaI family thioesterase [Alphaproteobacteria bacterium]
MLEVNDQRAVLRMPFSNRICRDGGMICGQALMSLADTAMVIAVVGASGGYRPMTTVDMSAHFMKPTSNKAVICTARIMRMGRTMAFGHVILNGEGDENPIVSATAACALLEPAPA